MSKELYAEIDRLVPGTQNVTVQRVGDNFRAMLESGPGGHPMSADGASADEALQGIIDRLRNSSNADSGEQAALNEARTNARMAAQLGKVTPFDAAINEGKSIEEARMAAEAAANQGESQEAREARQREDERRAAQNDI